DPGAASIGDVTTLQPLTGAPYVGEILFADTRSSALAGCKNVSFRWLRDGEPFAGAPHADDDAPNGFFSLEGHDGAIGQSGTSSNGHYTVGVTDLGHQISVRTSCADTTGSLAGVSVTTGGTAPVVTGFAADQPMLQAMEGTTLVVPQASDH